MDIWDISAESLLRYVHFVHVISSIIVNNVYSVLGDVGVHMHDACIVVVNCSIWRIPLNE